jgi:Ca2+-binding RTX toxin-like protein
MLESLRQEKSLYSYMREAMATIYGTNNEDYINSVTLGYANEQNTIYGYDGHDILYGGNLADYINGGTENDYISGGDGDDKSIWDSNGNRLFLGGLYGGEGQDFMYGGAGNDALYGEAGGDSLSGGSETDYIEGGEGSDHIYGDSGDDKNIWVNGIKIHNGGLYGGNGNDHIYGDEGSDVLYGDAGTDILWGGSENDTMYGGLDYDRLYGESGVDILYGNDGYDELDGGTGNDTLLGGNGDDVLYNNIGSDNLWGESGNDTFVFDGATSFGYIDRIRDFVTGDKIDISDILSDFGYNLSQHNLSDWVSITNNGTNSYLNIDQDGIQTAYNFVNIAVIEYNTNMSINDLVLS